MNEPNTPVPDESRESRTGAEPVPDASAEREPAEQGQTPTGAEPVPDTVQLKPAGPEAGDPATGGADGWKSTLTKLTASQVVIALLVGLLGFTLITQWRHNDDQGQFASARQEDLLRFLADLDAREQRLRQDIASLQTTKRELESDLGDRDKILTEARERADDLGILAGTEPARGSGVTVHFSDGGGPIKAIHLLDAVQELRNAGAEAMQLDAAGNSVRIIASTYFAQEGDGAVVVDGQRLTGPYVIIAIGNAETMRKALQIPGGVTTKVQRDNGNVIVNEHGQLDVKTVRPMADLEYAKPVA